MISLVGTDPLDMEASLTAPNGKTELCDIMDLEADLYDIKFKPEMEGVHTVSLKQKGLHISGIGNETLVLETNLCLISKLCVITCYLLITLLPIDNISSLHHVVFSLHYTTQHYS